MPAEILPFAQQIGATGALLLLLALWLLHKGAWYPGETVRLQNIRIAKLESTIDQERKDHAAVLAAARREYREELSKWEQRTFNAVGLSALGLQVAADAKKERGAA